MKNTVNTEMVYDPTMDLDLLIGPAPMMHWDYLMLCGSPVTGTSNEEQHQLGHSPRSTGSYEGNGNVYEEEEMMSSLVK